MRKIYDLDYYRVRTIYIILFLFCMLTRVVVPIMLIVPSKVDSLIFSAMAVFGLALLLINYFINKQKIFTKENLVLLCFLACMMCSSILNVSYGITGNLKTIVWMAIYFFVFYQSYDSRSKDQLLDEVKIISNIFIFVWFVLSSISLLMFALDIKYVVASHDGGFVRQGFYDSRLFGIFGDPNYASVVSLVTIVFSILNHKLTCKKKLKIFYVVNIVIQFLYFVLSGSRTAEISGIFGIVAVVSFAIFENPKVKGKGRIRLLASCFLGSALAVAVFLLLIKFTKTFAAFVPSIIGSISNNENQNMFRPITIVREDVSNSTDISNLRFKIWQSAIELFKTTPLLGTSPRNMIRYAKAVMPGCFIAERDYMIHNGYIDVLTSTGIVGAIVVSVFFVMQVRNIACLFLKFNFKGRKMLLFASLPVLIVGVSAFFLSEIFFINTVGGLIFWLCLGYTKSLSNCSEFR